MKKLKVGVLGATGSVGQKFVELLADHPWFELTVVAASERSAGKNYAEATKWFMSLPMPKKAAGLKVEKCEPVLDCELVFSGLDSAVAGEIEENFAQEGYLVVSNAKNHRLREDVPLLIPEVNSDHLDLIKKQPYGKGGIITNPNCSTVGLALALKPLKDRFGLKSVQVTTLQAVSGAGYPGVASLDILDNVVPYISGEEEKIQVETRKILGSFADGKVLPADLVISASCNRVPVLDGHLECVTVKLAKKAQGEDLIQVWEEFRSVPQELRLPMAPVAPICYFRAENHPQPRLHRNLDKGMAVSIGRLRECPLLDYKFVLLSHNTIRGAAGGAILNAELYCRQFLNF